MQNDPELNPKYLGTISSDFIKVADNLKDAAYQIRKQNFSKFPIFPISKVEIPIGQMLYEPGFAENSWYYNASFIEEFEQRGLVENADDFKQAYKNPDEFCCLFVVDEEFTNFIFIPFPEDEQ
ncbi:MAG: hypothetical protein GY816_09635 [Cytophagales bacterium]|nr:hypothetical protein [Cytophagales bacterium]